MCCEKEFNKMPSEIKKTANNFCSRSCAAKINNKKQPIVSFLLAPDPLPFREHIPDNREEYDTESDQY